MKRYWYLGVILLVLSAFTGDGVWGQTYAPDAMYVYNSSGTTLLGGKFVKLDTSWTMLGVALDTAEYLHQWPDTSATGTGSANCSTFVGSTQLKGLLSDTLKTKTAGLYQVRGIGVTNASGADCVFVYGWGKGVAYGFGSRTDSGAVKDTLIFATGTITSTISKYAWWNIDSVRIRTANAGLDCVRIYYRGLHNVTNADSIGVNTLGVVLGANRGGNANTTGASKDSIKSTGWGYVATGGVVRVWADGGSRDIEVGDMLSVGTHYKAQKFHAPKIDTVRTSLATQGRFVKGAREWDIVNITPIRTGLNKGTTVGSADSSKWGAEVVTDSVRFIQITTSGAPSSGFLVDSLMYQWTPRAYSDKGMGMVVGHALEQATTDSVAILIYLGK